jgi:hypothetical protein
VTAVTAPVADVDEALTDAVPCDDVNHATERRWLVFRRDVADPCDEPAVVMVRLLCRCGDCCPECDGPNQMALCTHHLNELIADAGAGAVDILDIVPIGAGS